MASFFGNSVTLFVDHDSNGSYTQIGQVLDATPPSRSHEMVDFTVIGDTYESMAASPIESAGEWTFTLLMDADGADQVILEGLVGGAAVPGRMVFPFSTKNEMSFNCIVKEMSGQQVVGADSIKVQFTLHLTSAPAWS